MAVLPDAEVSLGEIFALDDGPVVLLDGGAGGVGEAAEAGFGLGEGGGCEERGDENPFGEAHRTSFVAEEWVGDTSFGGGSDIVQKRSALFDRNVLQLI